MRLDRAHRTINRFRRPFISAIVGVAMAGAALAGQVGADPADDALAKLNELSRQAKDLGSAAVFLSLVYVIFTWLAILIF